MLIEDLINSKIKQLSEISEQLRLSVSNNEKLDLIELLITEAKIVESAIKHSGRNQKTNS